MPDARTTALYPWQTGLFERLNRARSEGKLGHAWLIAGPRGIGKLQLALAFAGRLLEPSDSTPRLIAAASLAEPGEEGAGDAPVRHPDLHGLVPEPEKRQISVDQVRESMRALELTSLNGGAKVLFVAPAEAMTLAAANALLKTLEEPTAQTYFFLVTHQPGALPLTIRSRCQLLSVPTPATADSAAWLAALAGGVPPEDLELLLALAQGAPLRALELIENDFISINSQLEEHFNQITGEKTDAQAVADHWLKADPGLYLNWLKVRLEWAIKGRLAPNAWTPVTDLRGDTLHNAWGRLTLTALFERLRETQALLGQLGRGINVDLALRVLLLGFERESGPA